MDKKSINELRRRLKKDSCTFTKVCGCYVNDQKEKVTTFNQQFLNLEDEEYFKYMEIAKKVLSTNIGNNVLQLEFLPNEQKPGGHQQFLMGIKKSALNDEGLLNSFYDMIIEKYEFLGNYLILLFHNRYDVMRKTSDNKSLDESEEVYEYIICAICPMTLTKPGLGYKKNEKQIRALNREWAVGKPESGFVFPAFIERETDMHSVLMYIDKPKNPHQELITEILGCKLKHTFEQKQEMLSEMVAEAMGTEEVKDVMDTVNIELAKLSEAEQEDIDLSSEHIVDALEVAGLQKQSAEGIGNEYMNCVKDDVLPRLSDIVPKKAIKILKDNNEKVILKEENKELKREVETIKEKEKADVVIKVSEEIRPLVKKEQIDGNTYILIPIEESDIIAVNHKEF